MGVSVVVFTRDLRLADNPALDAAVRAPATVPLFVLDEAILRRVGTHANRLAFLLASLRDLDAGLRRAGGALVLRAGPWVPTVIRAARDAGAASIHVAEDVSGYAAGRLAALERAAATQRITVVRHPGVTVVEPAAVRGPGGGPYQVFTPYHRRWLAAAWRPVLPAPDRITLPDGIGGEPLPRLAELCAAPPSVQTMPGGESAGLAAVRRWAATGLAGYDRLRDALAADATSRLSPYLHFGCVSPLAVATQLGALPGGEAFARQLAWRDFFHQLLAARPDAAHRDYRDRGDTWRDDPDGLAAWQEGRTGYPVVDAAMRQLTAEGFMHNRARMIVASFLTKDLCIDWRAGAAHFMRHLADADVANNQLNWQWVAGTGTDSNPHRVFNPTVQGRRFDADGEYIRRYLPELAGLPAAAIHDPEPAARRARGYPEPIVDHAEAIAVYRATRQSAARRAPRP